MNEIVRTFMQVVLVSLTINMSLFAIASWRQTDTLTDLAYGSSFFASVLFLTLTSSEQLAIPALMLVSLVVVWSVRLTTYLFYRIHKIKKDDRFDGIRESFLSFFKFWFLQSIAVAVILLPTILVITKNPIQPLLLLFIGVGISLFGLVYESIADWQKFTFKSKKTNKDKLIMSGLWKYSRHPNYFGEMLVWWGTAIAAVPVLVGLEWLVFIGPLFITYLLRYGTGIPPLEKRYGEKYKGDKEVSEYRSRVPLLIPYFS